MELSDIKTALLTIGVPVSHYFAETEDEKYIIWAEEGEGNSLSANDEKVAQTIAGTIDYFTKDEYDPNFGKIQEKLNELEIGWRFESVQHEEKTGYTHYEWTWEML